MRLPLGSKLCGWRRRAPVLWAMALLCGRTLGPSAVINVDETKAHMTARAGPPSRTSAPRVQPRQAPMASPGASSLGGGLTLCLWPNPWGTGNYQCRRNEGSYDGLDKTVVPHKCSPGPAAPGAHGGAGRLSFERWRYFVAEPSGHRLLLLSTNRRLIRPLGWDRHSAPIFHCNCRARRRRRRRAPDFGLRPELCGQNLGPPAAIIVDEPKAHTTAGAERC